MIASALDTLLDRTVLAGYTSIGYRLRRRSWDGAGLRALDGRVVLVSGASSGIGLAAAEGFARLGASVWLLARSEERGERARAQIVQRSGNSDVHVGLGDLSELASVRRFAESFAAQPARLDVLVNNAGALLSQRTLSADGVELTFATNVLGPFLLTSLLTPALAREESPRIINVSSGGMYTQRIAVEDLQSAREGFDGAAAYARSKRAQVILSELWAERLEGTGVIVAAMHPGWVDTPGLESSLPRFHTLTRRVLRTPQEGADTILWLGAAPGGALGSGGFWHDRRRRPTHLVPWTRETRAERERLWDECVRLSGANELPAATSNT